MAHCADLADLDVLFEHHDHDVALDPVLDTLPDPDAASLAAPLATLTPPHAVHPASPARRTRRQFYATSVHCRCVLADRWMAAVIGPSLVDGSVARLLETLALVRGWD
ncbi:hypothetical protein DENSPDRAFT_885858 [Dentipellis sp. KUC8613]|nr:hypothetical protein DENSPDRAFT_885858 [Dentipellis sp. KUC8613]